MENRNKIVEKINKLLALGQSSNENEAKVALGKARELMGLHKLTERDITKKDNKVIEMEIPGTSRGSWRKSLLVTLSKYNCCSIIIDSRYNGKRFESFLLIVGNKLDCEIVRNMYVYCLKVIDYNVKQLKKQNKSYRGITNDFAVGFNIGLREMFLEQNSNNSEWGLVMQTPKEVLDYVAEATEGGSKYKNTSYYKNSNIVSEGREKGRNIKFNAGAIE